MSEQSRDSLPSTGKTEGTLHVFSAYSWPNGQNQAESEPADGVKKGLETLLRGRAGTQHG